MPGMIAADLYPGRRLRLGDVLHRIERIEDHGGTLVLAVQDDTGRLVSIPRGTLLAWLCDETATLEIWVTGGPPK
jgi:hypothetical protein